MPLGLRFAAEVNAAREVRRVAPIPPVCELVAPDLGSVGALRGFAEALDQTGECGIVAAATCDLLLVPRKAVLVARRRTASPFEARHAAWVSTQAAAARRPRRSRPRGAVDDDAATTPMGRRRSAEDDAWRRARGADRPALRPAPGEGALGLLSRGTATIARGGEAFAEAALKHSAAGGRSIVRRRWSASLVRCVWPVAGVLVERLRKSYPGSLAPPVSRFSASNEQWCRGDCSGAVLNRFTATKELRILGPINY